MNGRKGILIVILFALVAAGAIQAQRSPDSQEEESRRSAPQGSNPAAASTLPAEFYRLDFAIREMEESKDVDTRHYSLFVQAGALEQTTMTAGSEVPYPSSASSNPQGTVKNISYRSVGVSIYCTVSLKEGESNLRLFMTLNISDALPPEKGTDLTAFRKVTLKAQALLTPGKPTLVGSVEDPASRHRFQVDVTATKLN